MDEPFMAISSKLGKKGGVAKGVWAHRLVIPFVRNRGGVAGRMEIFPGKHEIGVASPERPR
jgi:hypothetical protein